MTYTVVQFTPHAPIGDVMHRKTWPMQALSALPEFRVMDVHHLSPHRYRLALEADLLIVDTTFDPDFVPLLLWRKAKGKPTAFELQDHIFNDEPWSPAFSVGNNPGVQSECLQLMRLVDLVQTTTPFLADVFRPHCTRVAAFPNQLFQAPQRLPEKPASPLVVGWGGSDSHYADVACVAPTLSKWIAAHDDAVIWIMGAKAIADLFDVPAGRLRYLPPAGMDAYEEFLKGVHIGLAPLRDTVFNRARTDVKWLEYAANGCVLVGRAISTYTESVEDGKTGFLYRDHDDLLRILDRLHRDRALLASVAGAAFDHVTATRLHAHHVQGRAKIYRELLERQSPEGTTAHDLDTRSTFPPFNRPDPLPPYLALKPSPEEEKALADLYSPQSNVPEASIRFVEQRYGEFHLVAEARGRIAMVRRDFLAAERCFRHAVSLYPGSVRGLVLLGRTLATMARFEEARDAFAQAARWNPGCAPAYRALATLAEQKSDWAQAVSVAEEWERNCLRSPWAGVRKGVYLARSGKARQGVEAIAAAVRAGREECKGWQAPFLGELVPLLRQADGMLSGHPGWDELVLGAAEAFPQSLWLASRAGEILFRRGDYAQARGILARAREHLLTCYWQGVERADLDESRRLVEIYRTVCEDLSRRPAAKDGH